MFDSPQIVRDWLRLRLGHLPHETFCVLLLDARHCLIDAVDLFRGTLTQTSVYPREVVKLCLARNAAAVIFAHNHPSGIPEPSDADDSTAAADTTSDDAARANYVRTSLSLASTLHIAHLDKLAARMGPDSETYGPIYTMLLDHPVGRFLQSQGFRFTQVGSWFPPTRESEIADTMLRPGVSADFGTLVWNATIVPPIQRIVAPAAKDDETSRSVTSALYQWDQLGRLCTQVGGLRGHALAVLYPPLTLFVIVITANHFFLGAGGGALILCGGLGIVRWSERRRPRRGRSGWR